MLGENATFVVDEFIYDPSRSRGELSVGVVKGAFLYAVGGLIERGTGPKVQIRAPLGLRLRHCSSPTRFTFIEDKHTDNEALGSPFKCRFGHTQFIAGNDGRARIAFSNGSGGCSSWVSTPWVPVFSPRSAGARWGLGSMCLWRV